MYQTRSEYDRGVNTFSPEGRLFQVEYAIEAVKLGSTAVGIQTPNGVILAIEKRLTSVLLEPSSVEKIMEVDFHIGAAVSGLIGGMRSYHSPYSLHLSLTNIAIMRALIQTPELSSTMRALRLRTMPLLSTSPSALRH